MKSNKKEQEETERINERIDTLQHQVLDLKDDAREIRTNFDKNIQDIHRALNILDEDLFDLSKQKDALGPRIKGVEDIVRESISTLKLFGEVTMKNKKEIENINNSVEKLFSPETKEVMISNDADLDKFRELEKEIENLKENQLIVFDKNIDN